MIEYRNTAENITPKQLESGFFQGWLTPPSPQTHLKLLQQSQYIWLAVDRDSQAVVGYIAALSDNVLTAYISQLEVVPAYQSRGIGRALVEHMQQSLAHLYMIDLICDADIQPFYEQFGMTRYTGMIKRNYERQSGE